MAKKKDDEPDVAAPDPVATCACGHDPLVHRWGRYECTEAGCSCTDLTTKEP